MKKLLLILVLLCSLKVSSQTSERETRLLQAVNGFSAATLYNTYAVIGSVGDAYAKNAYDEKMVKQLMAAQENLAGNLVNLFAGLLKDSIVTAQADREYAVSSIAILNGLKLQAELLQEFADTDSNKKKVAYEEQRKKNWSAISLLMGIKE
jgi:hypothetical protein